LGHGLQSRRIEGVLALEVVVEQGLVDAGGLGNLLGAGAGQPVFAELMDGGVEDAGAVWSERSDCGRIGRGVFMF